MSLNNVGLEADLWCGACERALYALDAGLSGPTEANAVAGLAHSAARWRATELATGLAGFLSNPVSDTPAISSHPAPGEGQS
jgi:hypothetical protein